MKLARCRVRGSSGSPLRLRRPLISTSVSRWPPGEILLPLFAVQPPHQEHGSAGRSRVAPLRGGGVAATSTLVEGSSREDSSSSRCETMPPSEATGMPVLSAKISARSGRLRPPAPPLARSWVWWRTLEMICCAKSVDQASVKR